MAVRASVMCEAQTFTEWSKMMVPTYSYAEDGKHALKVYRTSSITRLNHQIVRVAHIVSLSELKVQVARDCVGRFGRNLHGRTAHSARRALCDRELKVAGDGTPVHAQCAVYLGTKTWHGDIFNPPCTALLS